VKQGKKKISRPASTAREPYFGPNVHNAICEYKSTDDRARREHLYNSAIAPALNKLVENLIFVYRFAGRGDNVTEIQSDCVTFLYENLYKFDYSRGTKAFSYFNVIARNWLIINSRKRTKARYKHVSIDDEESLSSKERGMIARHSVVDSPDDLLIRATQRERMRTMLTKIANGLVEEHEKSCMNAIITVFETLDDVDILHKRAIFIYVRELSNLNNKLMSAAMATIRRRYKELVENGEGLY